MNEKVTKEKISKLLAEEKIERTKNIKNYYNNKSQQSKAFLKLVDAVMEYLK